MPRPLSGQGSTEVAAARDHVWSALLDPDILQRLTPGADRVQRLGIDRFEASLSFGVGGCADATRPSCGSQRSCRRARLTLADRPVAGLAVAGPLRMSN